MMSFPDAGGRQAATSKGRQDCFPQFFWNSDNTHAVIESVTWIEFLAQCSSAQGEYETQGDLCPTDN